MMISLRLAWCFFVLLLVSSCSEQLETVEMKDEYGYTERFTRRKSDFARQGVLLRYDPEGKLVEEVNYESDTLHGLRILYYSEGDTQTVETYDRGLFEGPWRTYYENGVLKQEGLYAGNQMTGEWRRYYQNGQLMEVVTFSGNAENGPFVEYYPDGKLKAEGAYLDGDYEHGLLKEYNEQGILVRKAQCENGICRTIWRAEPASTDN